VKSKTPAVSVGSGNHPTRLRRPKSAIAHDQRAYGPGEAANALLKNGATLTHSITVHAAHDQSIFDGALVRAARLTRALFGQADTSGFLTQKPKS